MSEEIGLKVRGGIPEDTAPEPEPKAEVAPPTAPVAIAEAPLPGLRNEPSSAPTPSASMSVVRYLDEPLWRAKGWITLMGVLSLIHGALCILSLWGILFCWLPIWLGLTLLGAAKNIRAAAELDNQDLLRTALEKVALYFKILGVLTVVGMILCVVAFVAGALGFIGSAAMMNEAMSGMNAP